MVRYFVPDEDYQKRNANGKLHVPEEYPQAAILKSCQNTRTQALQAEHVSVVMSYKSAIKLQKCHEVAKVP